MHMEACNPDPLAVSLYASENVDDYEQSLILNNIVY